MFIFDVSVKPRWKWYGMLRDLESKDEMIFAKADLFRL